MAEEDLASFETALHLYVQHLLRKAISSRIEPALLKRVKQTPTLCHLVIDHKQKWLPKSHEETQQEGFGKRGISIFGGAATRWVGNEYHVLNIRVACDDASQGWFQTLGCTRIVLDVIRSHWLEIIAAAVQSDGASNLNCTAFMCALPRCGQAAGIRIESHDITEVGGGKTKQDTDFQQVTLALNQYVDSGGSATNAQQIMEGLDANPTLGSVNAAIELNRELEPGKGHDPKPYKGIDGVYSRNYGYDASGRCTHVTLRQYFEIGAGKRVPMSSLRALWRDESKLDAAAGVQPTRLQPTGGERAAEAKVKVSEKAEQQAKHERNVKRNRKWQRRYSAMLSAAEEERQRQCAAKTFCCRFAGAGCPHRPFLSKVGAEVHAQRHCEFNPDHSGHDHTSSAYVKVRVLCIREITELSCL